ncbi:MAG TPA: YdeI/OmpD-associated family protein, partial [Solirubrobacteraceae bacterium]|nr:YdeI/OmpD-associated family protein [Solirubrobacteraceae bacterium]
PDGRAIVDVADRAAWRAWLREHHAGPDGAWVLMRTRASGDDGRLRYAEAVEEALCFGWIDSRANQVDDVSYLQWFAPRRRGSNWSRLNKQRVERLAAAGLMAPAGVAAVDAARADGTWTALDAVEDLAEPGDLRAALDASSAARTAWDGFPRSARRAILEWIEAAKRPETRARRVAETAALAAEGVRANQWPRRARHSRASKP